VHAAREAGLAIEVAAVAGTRLASPSVEGAAARALEQEGVQVVSVSDPVLSAISPVRTPSGIVAIARRTPVQPDAVCAREDGFVVIALDVQNPGNLGSLLRAAEAGGATGALVCGVSANPFSWKALRGSMGSALRFPIAHGLDPSAALACPRRFGARTVAAVPRDGRLPDAIDWTGRVALLLGGEGPGLPDAIANQCDDRVTVPMAPRVESLNVALAAAVLVYAARRQRVPNGG
jgi:TrmH family RNA methyltransferase